MHDESGYSSKVDIWATGITIIAMAQGQPPYHDVNPMVLKKKEIFCFYYYQLASVVSDFNGRATNIDRTIKMEVFVCLLMLLLLIVCLFVLVLVQLLIVRVFARSLRNR